MNNQEHVGIQSGSTTTVFINQMLEQEKPIFAKQKVAFTPQYPARHLAANSGRITLILVNNLLLRIDTRSPDQLNGTYFQQIIQHFQNLFYLHSLEMWILINISVEATRYKGSLLILLGATF